MDRRALLTAVAAAGPLAVALAAPDSAQASAGEKKKGGGETFMQFPTLTATIVRPDGRRGIMTVEAGLDIADPDLLARAKAALPRLRADYALRLSTFAAAIRPGGAPDADRLSQELQRGADRVLGRAGAKLLLGTVMVN